MFDYDHFTLVFSKNINDVIPVDLRENEEKYIKENIQVSIFNIKKLICNINTYSDEQIEMIVQIISILTLKKSIGLYRAKIKDEYINEILEIVVLNTFSVIRKAIENNKDYEQILDIAEQADTETYKIILDKFPLSEIEKKTALNQSDIELTPNRKKIVEKRIAKYIHNIFHFASWIIVLFLFVGIVLYFGKYFSHSILFYIVVFCGVSIIFNYFSKKAIEEQMKQLEELQGELRNLVNPDRFLDKLSFDDISLEFGIKLLQICDPGIKGDVLPKIAALRQKVTDEYGYIIPSIRILDNQSIDDYKYNIYAQGINIASGYVYPDRYMIDEEQEKLNCIADVDTIDDVNPLTQKKVTWISKQDIIKISGNVKFLTATEVLISHFKEVAIQNADKILTIKNTYKYIDFVKKNYSEDIVNNLLEVIDVAEIKYVLSNLIKDRVSIQNIGYIFELIYYFARFDKQNQIISEKIKNLLISEKLK